MKAKKDPKIETPEAVYVERAKISTGNAIRFRKYCDMVKTDPVAFDKEIEATREVFETLSASALVDGNLPLSACCGMTAVLAMQVGILHSCLRAAVICISELDSKLGDDQ